MALWIVGAGGLGREVLDALTLAGVHPDGFVDDQADGLVAGLVVERTPPPGAELVIAIGDCAHRRDVVERLVGADDTGCASVIHPNATVAPTVAVARGVIVQAGAVVSVDAALGPHAQVHYGATIGHDTRVGAYATVLPGAHIAGNVTVGDGVLVGSGAVVLQGLALGAGARIGAGAVVTRDVPPEVTVTGIPARPH